MKNLENKRIAIVCDWIKDWWWAEMVLSDLMKLFPNADIFTSIFFASDKEIFKWRNVKTSFIQKIPFLNKNHKMAIFLRPFAFESFDLSEYDIVISSSSAESKGIITKPETLHFCYCHTPTRYFWSHAFEYKNMKEFGFFNLFASLFMTPIIHKLRMWDFSASFRVDHFIANSQNTANRIKKYYKRDSKVITPGVNLANVEPKFDKEDFYFFDSRCIPYKKFDLVVDAFNLNWKKIILSTSTDNHLYKTLKAKSNPNIEWRFWLSIQEINDLHSKAKAFIFPPDEDFWLVPIYAMASWTPVIAFWKWGALETVKSWLTWEFFDEQTPESLNKAIELFESKKYDYKAISDYAKTFSNEIFKQKIYDYISEKISKEGGL